MCCCCDQLRLIFGFGAVWSGKSRSSVRDCKNSRNKQTKKKKLSLETSVYTAITSTKNVRRRLLVKPEVGLIFLCLRFSFAPAARGFTLRICSAISSSRRTHRFMQPTFVSSWLQRKVSGHAVVREKEALFVLDNSGGCRHRVVGSRPSQ